MAWLINASQLDKFRKSQKSLIIIDATQHAPSTGRDAKQEFIQKHILGAQFLDIDILNDVSTDAPHPKMLSRDSESLSQKIGALGIRNDYKIIFYDNSALHTSCRALWAFKMLGHLPQQLYILDGGLNAWESIGGKTESGTVNSANRNYQIKFQEQYLRNLKQMKENLHHPKEQVVDLRHAVRFAGGPEDRPGLRSGHIPGSYSFPFSSFFDNQGLWRPTEKIRLILTSLGLDLSVPIITTCGSGTTAPIMNFALDILDVENNSVYNGSWTEWGALSLFEGEVGLEERPVETCVDN